MYFTAFPYTSWKKKSHDSLGSTAIVQSLCVCLFTTEVRLLIDAGSDKHLSSIIKIFFPQQRRHTMNLYMFIY